MAERKRPRRTRERILETSLALFNRLGEPHVTTADIAGEMNISPGNLYYHFRNKEAIVSELFIAHERELLALMVEPSGLRAEVEDLWLLLHLWLERMQAYGFLYRDLVDLTTRYARIARSFAGIVGRGEQVFAAVCRALAHRGELRASEGEIDALARNAMLVIVYASAYERIRGPAAAAATIDLGRAAYQVLSLFAPYLTGDSRRLIERLSHDYL